MKNKGNIEDILIDYYFSGPYIKQTKYFTMKELIENQTFKNFFKDLKEA